MEYGARKRKYNYNHDDFRPRHLDISQFPGCTILQVPSTITVVVIPDQVTENASAYRSYENLKINEEANEMNSQVP